jgi:hypothetical protein
MIYCIECDWQKMPKEETICIMDIRGAAFYFFMFLKFFLCFCYLQLMNFGLCFSWNVATQIKNWWWSFISNILFYCEDEDEVKRLAMHLVVDGNKYHKAKKVKHSWIQIHFFDFVFLVLLLWILGRMPEFNYVKILPFNFINVATLRLVGKTLCVNESIKT